MSYLSSALAMQPGLQLRGVRISGEPRSDDPSDGFEWPIDDIPLTKGALTTFYRRQRAQLGALVRQYRPDIIHAQGVDVEGLLAVGSGIRAVVTVHGVLSETARYKSGFRNRARATLTAIVTERRTIRRAKDVIAITPYITSHYARQIQGRIHDIPNAVAPGFFEIVRRPESGRLLFAGRVSRNKGVMDLVYALARCREPRPFVIAAGACPEEKYKAKVQRESRRLRIAPNIEFVGLLSESALMQEFARAEALLLPSYQETAPMVIQQAMAAGLPVIASRVGGVPDQVEDGITGLLFTPGDVEGLSEAIERLRADPFALARMSEAARHVAISKYRASKVADATRAVYEIILNEPRR